MAKNESNSLTVKSVIISGIIIAVGVFQAVVIFQNAGLMAY